MIGEKCEYCGDNVFILKNFDGRKLCLDCYDQIKNGKMPLSQNVSRDDSRIDKIHAVNDGDITRYTQNMTCPPYSVNGTNKQKIAGILLILISILGVISGISIFIFGNSPEILQTYSYYETTQPEMLQPILYTCGTVVIILSVVTFLGGIATLKGKNRGFCILASILGIFTIGPLFICSILSLIVLFLIITSKNNYQSTVDPLTEENNRNRRCPSCGRIIPFDSIICPYCGKKFENYF